MREFLWGAVAGAFGEGMMHPVDTVKTRIQGQAILSASQKPKSIMHMVRAVWAADGLRAPGVTGSLATGATYFGVIESTKKWIEESHPSLEGHWAHFIAGALVQGTMASWSSVVMKDNIAMKPGIQMYGYYTGIFHAGCSIWNEQGLRGLYAGFVLQRLERFDRVGKQKYIQDPNFHTNSSVKGLALGGLAGGTKAGWMQFAAYGGPKVHQGCSEAASPGLHGIFQLQHLRLWLWNFSENISTKD
ncbi:uncharacterized protein [Malus domestica]|uniref:uncharacterized protein isoform X2 n=1 Tax=Malus domestica TaxID=3750 RepID=UPI0010AB156A|nr:mitochondrial substrate carrier family protein E-like isoform X2 [Malus domestica]